MLLKWKIHRVFNEWCQWKPFSLSDVTYQERTTSASKSTNPDFNLEIRKKHMGRKTFRLGQKGDRWSRAAGPGAAVTECRGEGAGSCLGLGGRPGWKGEGGTYWTTVPGPVLKLTCTQRHRIVVGVVEKRGPEQGAPTLPQAYRLYSQAHLKHPVFATDHKHLEPKAAPSTVKIPKHKTPTNLLFKEFNRISLAL